MSEWLEAIPLLASLQRVGKLVPFIGSGMSRPLCTDWPTFLARLKGAKTADSAFIQQENLRTADVSTRRLRAHTFDARAKTLLEALRSTNNNDADSMPPQTLALTQFHWPLVVSTNYDDVFWHAATLPDWKRDEYDIRGRNENDSRAVLRSLDWPSNSILWAIQGFVGGVCRPGRDSMPNPNRRRALLDEVVIGHRQYAEATFLNPVFRRAFSEVFRRRSFLFLGSGLVDEYLISLFSEVHLTLGQCVSGHFALLKKDDVSLSQARFLRDRLGIRPLLYSEHEEVSIFLQELLASTKFHMPAKFRQGEPECSTIAVRMSGIEHSLARRGGPTLKVVIDAGPMVRDSIKQRLDVIWAASVGTVVGEHPDDPPELKIGGMATRLLDDLGLNRDFIPVPGCRFVHVHKQDRRVVMLAARGSTRPGSQGRRALHAVYDATKELLEHAIAQPNVDVLRIGLISAGPSTIWHPSYSLAAMLSASREFYPSCERDFRIEISVVDSRVWARVASGNLPVHELLSNDMCPVLVDLKSQAGNVRESLVALVKHGEDIGQLFDTLDLNPNEWRMEVLPESAGEQDDSEIRKTRLFPYTHVSLSPGS